VIASCAPKEAEKKVEVGKPEVAVTKEKPEEEVVEEEAEVEMVKLRLKKGDGTVVEKLVEKPKYGGVLRWA
jgi:hypothetical protein